MQKQTPARRKQQKSRNFESRKLKSKTRGQRFHFPFSISAFYFLFSVFVLGLLDHGGWTRLVFRYQRSSVENQFEPTHVGCHLISALVLCVWRPGIGCSLLDVSAFRAPSSALRSALSSLHCAPVSLHGKSPDAAARRLGDETVVALPSWRSPRAAARVWVRPITAPRLRENFPAVAGRRTTRSFRGRSDPARRRRWRPAPARLPPSPPAPPSDSCLRAWAEPEMTPP